jgi:hypothetical protein
MFAMTIETHAMSITGKSCVGADVRIFFFITALVRKTVKGIENIGTQHYDLIVTKCIH